MKRRILIVGTALCMGLFSANAQTQNSSDHSEAKSSGKNQYPTEATSSIKPGMQDYNTNESSKLSNNENFNSIEDSGLSKLSNPNRYDNSFDIDDQSPVTENSNRRTINTQTVVYKESIGVKIVKAPFRFVGTTVKQTAKGVGHIAIAPFKGIGKAIHGRDRIVETVSIETSDN